MNVEKMFGMFSGKDIDGKNSRLSIKKYSKHSSRKESDDTPPLYYSIDDLIVNTADNSSDYEDSAGKGSVVNSRHISDVFTDDSECNSEHDSEDNYRNIPKNNNGYLKNDSEDYFDSNHRKNMLSSMDVLSPQKTDKTDESVVSESTRFGGALIGAHVGIFLSELYGKDFLQKALIILPCAAGGYLVDDYIKNRQKTKS